MKSSTSTLATRKSISLAIGLILLMILAGACSSRSARLTRVTVAGETSMKAQPDAAVVVLSVSPRVRKHLTRSRTMRARATQ